MNQPLHNNAIPAHPGIAAQQAAAQAPVQVSTPAPSENPQVEANANALWDAFGEVPVSSPEPLAPPPIQAAPQPPAPPPPPPEVPPSVDDLLAGGVSSPVEVQPPVQQSQEPVPAAPSVSAPIDFGALQKQAIDYLMANEYKLSDDDRTQLISAPDEVLPRLAARMHVGIASQLAQQVAQAIPAMIQQHMDTHMKAQRAEMEFFSQYPKLNRPEWKPIIAESLRMVKQMNPQATRDQVVREGAALAAFRVSSTYGKNFTPQPPQPPRGPQQPYVPVAPGGGVSPPNNVNQSNPWADLAGEDWNTW